LTESPDERSRRVGHNEALYRQVNERIEDLNEAFGAITGDFAVVCECGSLDCTEQIRVSREAYEQTRANPTRFLVRPGHEIPDVEHVVDRDGDYVVVEKDAPEAARFAEETDPRS
jgi:hypothetical protein